MLTCFEYTSPMDDMEGFIYKRPQCKKFEGSYKTETV